MLDTTKTADAISIPPLRSLTAAERLFKAGKMDFDDMRLEIGFSRNAAFYSCPDRRKVEFFLIADVEAKMFSENVSFVSKMAKIADEMIEASMNIASRVPTEDPAINDARIAFVSRDISETSGIDISDVISSVTDLVYEDVEAFFKQQDAFKAEYEEAVQKEKLSECLKSLGRFDLKPKHKSLSIDEIISEIMTVKSQLSELECFNSKVLDFFADDMLEKSDTFKRRFIDDFMRITCRVLIKTPKSTGIMSEQDIENIEEDILILSERIEESIKKSGRTVSDAFGDGDLFCALSELVDISVEPFLKKKEA